MPCWATHPIVVTDQGHWILAMNGNAARVEVRRAGGEGDPGSDATTEKMRGCRRILPVTIELF